MDMEKKLGQWDKRAGGGGEEFRYLLLVVEAWTSGGGGGGMLGNRGGQLAAGWACPVGWESPQIRGKTGSDGRRGGETRGGKEVRRGGGLESVQTRPGPFSLALEKSHSWTVASFGHGVERRRRQAVFFVGLHFIHPLCVLPCC